jgi:hypothetical protein
MDIIGSTARIAPGFVAMSCDPDLVLRARGVKRIIGSDKQIVVVLTAERGGGSIYN